MFFSLPSIFLAQLSAGFFTLPFGCNWMQQATFRAQQGATRIVTFRRAV